MSESVLTIAIPTVRYDPRLDQTVESILNILHGRPQLVININSPTEDFTASRYWRDARVRWERNDTKLPLPQSWNSAVRRANTPWVYLVSDDDIVLPNFLNDCDLSTADERDVFVIGNDTVNELGRTIQTTCVAKLETMSQSAALARHFNKGFHHHASMMVFPRALFEEIGGFPDTGYPTGHYTDIIFHLRAFARARATHYCGGVQFRRFTSLSQQSSCFFWNCRDLDRYFSQIINTMAEEPTLRDEILQRFGGLDSYRDDLYLDRLRGDIAKMRSFVPQLSKRRARLYLAFLFWKTSRKAKLQGLRIILESERSRLADVEDRISKRYWRFRGRVKRALLGAVGTRG
jgi:hypothetical protein